MFRIKNYYSVIKRHVSTSPTKKSPLRATINIAFGKYLLLTNTGSSGVLMILGDVLEQEIEYQENKLSKRYDYGRLARMFLVGLALGPVHHYFYIYLHKVLPKRDLTSITKKIMLDQFVMSPVCIATFFYSIGLLELKSLAECTRELKDKAVEVYLMDWCVWPPTQFINFFFVPIKYQVLYINGVTMIYNVFLSFIKHKEIAEANANKIQHINNKLE